MESSCENMLARAEAKMLDDITVLDDVTADLPLPFAEPPSFERVLEELGAFGKFQKKQLIFGFLGSFITAFMTMSFVFLGYEPPHVCNAVNETELLSSHRLLNHSSATISYDSCDILISVNRSGPSNDVIKMSCPNGRNFSAAEHTTFLSEWDLVCEATGQAEISHMIFTCGQLAGGIIVSTVADILGRKPVLIITSFFAFVMEFCVIFAPGIYVVYGLRFFCGLFFQGLSCCFFVHGMELMLPKHRQVYGVVICIIWVFQLLLVGGAAYLLQGYSWRYFQGAVAASGIMFFVYPLFLLESPRWLAVSYRFEESLGILKQACDMNGKDFEKVRRVFNTYAAHLNKIKTYQSDDHAEENSEGAIKENGHVDDDIVPCKEGKSRKDSILTLLSHRKFIVMTLTAWYIWITHNVTYYGLYMTSSTLVGNRFFNYSLMAIVEIPSNLLILVIMSKMSRRFVLRLFLSTAAICLLCSTLLVALGTSSGSHNILSTALFVAGKFAISASFNVLYIVTPEIFPTSLRASGAGSCTSVDKIGSMVTPFLRPLSAVAVWGPGVIFTSMCVIALCLTPLLPETKDVNLPSTLKDAEMSQTDTSSSSSEEKTELVLGEDTL